jgi:RNA polymerase sigma-70 factor (ECF subfamily)
LKESEQFPTVSLASVLRNWTASCPATYQCFTAFRFLGNMPDAEDAVQDALLSAYKHLGQFRGQAQLSTWLTTIVTNAALMKLRRRDSYLSLDEEQGEDGLTFSERLPDSKPSPEELCSAAEARDQLVEGVRQLSPKLRRTLQLRDIDGLTTKEAALVLGVPHGTVKARLARARAKLARSAHLKPIKRSFAGQVNFVSSQRPMSTSRKEFL